GGRGSARHGAFLVKGPNSSLFLAFHSRLSTPPGDTYVSPLSAASPVKVRSAAARLRTKPAAPVAGIWERAACSSLVPSWRTSLMNWRRSKSLMTDLEQKREKLLLCYPCPFRRQAAERQKFREGFRRSLMVRNGKP